MVRNLGRDLFIIKSSQYGFSIVMIRETCSRLLEELKSRIGKIFISIWVNANGIKAFVILFQPVQLLLDL